MHKLLFFLVCLPACLAPPVDSPTPKDIQETDVTVSENARNKVDILFMIDNSSSMEPMQIELRARFGDFFKVFTDLAATGTVADLHIGVVTSDYGAGDAAGGGCDASPGGQHGYLQTSPAPKALNPPANCAPPTGGAPYIAYAFGQNGAAPVTNLPSGSDATALINEFTCMASVGASGCGFEHQLESVYAALHNTKENAGFLRSDALLTIVFVTNEDDGSAAPGAKFYESDAVGMYGQYSTYRQTRFAVDCGGMQIPYGMPDGTLTDCLAAPNPMMDVSAAYDISRYVDFFTKPGGAKANPADVILVGIDGPETPFATIIADSTKGNAPYVECPTPMLGTSCIQALQHSCENIAQPGFFADPSVRLNAVIKAATQHNIASICGDDLSQPPDFTNALEELAKLISNNLGVACLSSPITDPGHPDCVVEDHANGDKHIIDSVPWCGTSAPPCWAYVENDKCAKVVNPLNNTVTQGSIGIMRDQSMIPAASYLSVSCATVPHSPGPSPHP